MTVMRRNNGWAFAAWVPDAERGRRQVWKGGYRTKREAAAAERRFLVDAEDRANQVPDAPSAVASRTLETFPVDWLEQSASTRRPTTSVSYDKLVRQHIAPHLGAVTLAALAPADIRAWHAILLRKPKRWGGAPLSPTTVRTTHGVLRRALQDALRWELIDRNPCDAVIAPRRAEVEMRAWDAKQARAFLAHVDGDRLATMWRLFVATGMRRGEVAGLRWIDVDLAHSRLAVRSTRVLVYSDVQVVEPKTRRSRRSVSLDAGTVAALHAHRVRQDAERRYAGDKWTETGHVFVRDDGRPVDPDRITHLFGVAVTACGLPRIRLHDLRHTAATLTLGAGVHPKVVSERLGHSSITITLDTYSHVLPSMQEDAAAKRSERRLLANAVHRALSAEYHSRRQIESVRRSMERAAAREADKEAGVYWASREAGRTAQRPVRVEVEPAVWEAFKRKAERARTTVGEQLGRLADKAQAHDALATPGPTDGERRLLFVRIAIDDDAWLEFRHLTYAAGWTTARYLGALAERNSA